MNRESSMETNTENTDINSDKDENQTEESAE